MDQDCQEQCLETDLFKPVQLIKDKQSQSIKSLIDRSIVSNYTQGAESEGKKGQNRAK